MVSRPVSFRIDIIDSAGANVFYSERHVVITDAQGILNLSIGAGLPLFGNISSVPWANGRKYVRTAIDTTGGSSFVEMGSSELMSVPYAQYAIMAGETTTAHVRGTRNLSLMDSAAGSVTTGRDNMAIGYQSLARLKTGEENVAIGTWAGHLVEGNRNVSIGMNAMRFSTASEENVAVGAGSLSRNVGHNNTALGSATLGMNTLGFNNVAIGREALFRNETGCCNVAIGAYSMGTASSVDHVVMIGQEAGRYLKASYNVGIGSNALYRSTGIFNVAVGNASLESNTTGARNTGVGQTALAKNLVGENNTAVGHGSLVENTVGNSNAAFGTYAMDANVSGNENAAFGRHSLQDNVNGSGNTSVGTESMYLSVSGFWNTAMGYQSLSGNVTGSENTSIGTRALAANVGGVGLIGIGAGSDVVSPALTNSTVIGQNARVGTSHTMSFGNASVTKWAFGLPTTPHALQVGSNTSNGNGAYLTAGGTWTNASSMDFKEGFEAVPSQEILDKLDSLDIPKWRYKGTDETHIGPMAEPFKRLFGLGAPGDDKHIGTVDANGIALRAIQALKEKLDAAERDRASLAERVRSLESMVRMLLEHRGDR